MPAPLALLLTLLLTGYLLRRDCKEEPRVSLAVWIPITWLMINGSRQVGQWLGGGTGLSAQALAEGNPIDQAVYAALIFAGLCVLSSRRVQVGKIITSNVLIVLLLLYEAFSILWSEFPLISLKRWIKGIGDPVMVLVLWSEPVPVRAITATIKRCAYVLVPLSVLFCKYYENIGRVFDSWGRPYYTGVTLDKNMFGYMLFAFGLFFISALMDGLNTYRDGHYRSRSNQIIYIMLLAMIVWLLSISDSKTATLALIIGAVVIFALRFGGVRRHFGIWALGIVFLASIFEALFSVKEYIFEASGRDPSFTGRSGLWETLLREPINPVTGVGYSSFWLGERLTRYWAMYPTSPPIQAHNGYLEVYLNLGLIGVCLIALVLWQGLRTIRNRMVASLALSGSEAHNSRVLVMFGMAYSVAYLFYNVTEATFYRMNFLFLIFLILVFREPAGAWRQGGRFESLRHPVTPR